MSKFGESHDEFYDARLVSNARLHLANVMNGQPSPLFFEAMVEIVKRKTYLGYLTIKGRQVKLSGIKDFMYNFHYGLGIRNMPEFISMCVELDVGRTKDKNLRAFLDWLKLEDEKSFKFPDHYWEYRRLQIAVYQMRGGREKKWLYLNMMKIMYNTHPEILKYIGINRKYRSIPEAYEKEGYMEKPKTLTPIKLYRNPTHRDIEALARNLNARLDKLKNRTLIMKLIEIYRINEAIERYTARSAPPDNGDEL
jgi:hypothetical protein